MKTTLLVTTFVLITTFQGLLAQTPTVGLIYHEASATLGYTLYSPEVNKTVYLVDNCGELVNSWQFGELPGATCYLLENGNLLRAGKDTLVIKDWNNNTLWSFAITAEWGMNQHHDIEPLPNGNILCIVSDNRSLDDAAAMGMDTSGLQGQIEFDKVIEIHPLGIDSAEIVWEWTFADHIIQDFDNTKPNFGVVGDHPELLDINFDHGFGIDLIHMNAIDYNANLDQILLSPRSYSEIMIIDHSTTTAEAATHAGGTSGKGGDFLWRWGNPQTYRQGQPSDQKLFLPHDCKWIENGYQDAGKITVFNNLGYSLIGDTSSIHIINPVIANNTYQLSAGHFLPETYEWSWKGEILGSLVFENKKSGTHALPNGNFIIAETSKGKVSEINRNGQVVWSYINPTAASSVYNQFDVVAPPTNRFFRAEKYPAEFPGFVGKNMSGNGILEDVNPVSDTCYASGLGVYEADVNQLSVVNPVKNGTIQFLQNLENVTVQIVDAQGKKVLEVNQFSGKQLQLNVQSGVYLLRVLSPESLHIRKILVE